MKINVVELLLKLGIFNANFESKEDADYNT